MNIVHFDDDDVLSIVMFTRSFQGNTTVKAGWLCYYKHSFLKLLFHSQLINVLKIIFQEISRHDEFERKNNTTGFYIFNLPAGTKLC